MIRAPLIALAVVGSLAECERAPAEDFPPHQGAPLTASAAVGPAAPPEPPAAPATPSGRCVEPTPAEAPHAVAPGPAPGCPVDPEPDQPKAPLVQVKFPDAPGGGLSVEAELVRSEHDTMRGLMYRKTMAPGHGMLFDLRVRDDHKFWMHNTCIPLDLMYVDEDGLVVGIVENAPTLDDTARGVGCPSRYVLEVNAGWCRQHGVKAGSKVTLPEHRTTLTVPSNL